MILEVMPQPHFPFRGVLEVRVGHAVDDVGQTLMQSLASNHPSQPLINARNAGPADFNGYSYLGGLVSQRIAIGLSPGERPSTRLSRIEGNVIAQVQTPFEPVITVNSILQAAGRSFKTPDGLSLKIVNVTTDRADRVRIQLNLQDTVAQAAFAGRRAFPANRIILGNGQQIIERPAISPWTSFSLLDDKDQRYTLRGVENSFQGRMNGLNQESTLTYVGASGQGKPSKLVLSGQRTAIVEIPFKLSDVVLH